MENRSALSFSCLIQVNGCLMDLFTVGDITKFNHEFGKYVVCYVIFTTENHPLHLYVPGYHIGKYHLVRQSLTTRIVTFGGLGIRTQTATF